VERRGNAQSGRSKNGSYKMILQRGTNVNYTWEDSHTRNQTGTKKKRAVYGPPMNVPRNADVRGPVHNKPRRQKENRIGRAHQARNKKSRLWADDQAAVVPFARDCPLVTKMCQGRVTVNSQKIGFYLPSRKGSGKP